MLVLFPVGTQINVLLFLGGIGCSDCFSSCWNPALLTALCRSAAPNFGATPSPLVCTSVRTGGGDAWVTDRHRLFVSVRHVSLIKKERKK